MGNFITVHPTSNPSVVDSLHENQDTNNDLIISNKIVNSTKIHSRGTIVILGLNNAGKTTLIHRFVHINHLLYNNNNNNNHSVDCNYVCTPAPTLEFEQSLFYDDNDNIPYRIIEFPGSQLKDWYNFKKNNNNMSLLKNIKLILFIIDSTDIVRFPTITSEINRFYHLNPLTKLHGTPLLLLLSKMDKHNAKNKDQVRTILSEFLSFLDSKNKKSMDNYIQLDKDLNINHDHIKYTCLSNITEYSARDQTSIINIRKIIFEKLKENQFE